jgi:hypothetical protein
LALPDFENVRLAGELCRCGSGETRGKCCFKAPYVVAGSKGHLDDATVQNRMDRRDEAHTFTSAIKHEQQLFCLSCYIKLTAL